MSKLFGRKKKYREITIPTDSFSDIAFLLIIYFLVATSLVKIKSISADLPAAIGAACSECGPPARSQTSR